MTKKRTRHEPDKVTAALEALLESQPPAEPSLLDQVAKHLDLIEKLRERRHSFGRIAEALQQAGVEITENTLRLYTGRLRRQTSSARHAQGRGPDVPPVPKTKVRVRRSAVNPAPLPAARANPPKNKTTEVAAWLTDEPDETQI